MCYVSCVCLLNAIVHNYINGFRDFSHLFTRSIIRSGTSTLFIWHLLKVDANMNHNGMDANVNCWLSWWFFFVFFFSYFCGLVWWRWRCANTFFYCSSIVSICPGFIFKFRYFYCTHWPWVMTRQNSRSNIHHISKWLWPYSTSFSPWFVVVPSLMNEWISF